MTDLKEAKKADIRGYFSCCPLCGSKKLAVYLEGTTPNTRHFIVDKRFFKDLKGEEKSKEFFREVLDPKADSKKKHKFEELENSHKVSSAKIENPRIVCCVDKNMQVLYMHVFKNIEKYEKFIKTDEGIDTLSCYGCGAKWHLHMGITGFKWAELKLENEDGRGVELLGKKVNKKAWRKMAQNAQETTTPKSREKPNEKQPDKSKKLKKKKKRAK